VSADVEGDVAGVVEGIEHREEALARDTEDGVHAVGAERLDEKLATGALDGAN
jgi:hypothetical protein